MPANPGNSLFRVLLLTYRYTGFVLQEGGEIPTILTVPLFVRSYFCMKRYNAGIKILFQNDFAGKLDAKIGRQCAKLYGKTVAPYQI